MIGTIENAMLARAKLAADADLLGYKWQSLETYPQDWDEWLKDKVDLRAPALWVGFRGWSRPESTGTIPRLPAMFVAVVMAENKRNEQATRHGDPAAPAAKPGSYQLLVDVTALINGNTLGLDIDTMQVGRSGLVIKPAAMKERKVSMMFVEFHTAFTPGEPGEFNPDLGDFQTFHANWDIPTFGNVDGNDEAPGVQIPADDTADATDHVHMETD